MVFRIPVKWSHWGIHEVEASSLEEALHFVNYMPLPSLEEYIKDSFQVLKDQIEELKE